MTSGIKKTVLLIILVPICGDGLNTFVSADKEYKTLRMVRSISNGSNQKCYQCTSYGTPPPPANKCNSSDPPHTIEREMRTFPGCIYEHSLEAKDERKWRWIFDSNTDDEYKNLKVGYCIDHKVIDKDDVDNNVILMHSCACTGNLCNHPNNDEKNGNMPLVPSSDKIKTTKDPLKSPSGTNGNSRNYYLPRPLSFMLLCHIGVFSIFSFTLLAEI